MVKINQNKCIGCGICQSVCPEGFEIIGGKARIKDDKADCIQQAIEACPRNVITLDESQEQSKSISNENLERSMGQRIGFGRGNGQGMGQGRGQGRGSEFGKGRNRA
jgi:ferredoxin